MKYFISDTHFSHNSITQWERTRFADIAEHDKFLVKCFTEWAEKLNKDPDNELWVLGDWGNTDYLWVIDMFICKTVFVYGNHDAAADLEVFEAHFDEVYQYPTFISQKIVVSHFPQAVYDDQLCICGHLHAGDIDSRNHICVSIDKVDYKLVSENTINGALGQLPKFNRRWLWEPWAELYNFKNYPDRDRDTVYNKKTGRIDLSASRLLQKIQKEQN